MSFVLENIYAYDILAAVYLCISILISKIFLFKIDFSLVLVFKYDVKFLQLIGLYLLIGTVLIWVKIKRNKHRIAPHKLLIRVLRRKYFNLRQLFKIIKILIWLKLVLFVYCNIKQAIPFINPTLYDKELVVIDRILGFGYNPYVLVTTYMNSPVLTSLIDKLYYLWYPLKPFVLVYFASLPIQKNYIHKRFFFTYFATWIFGGLFALLFPSLGPIYVFTDQYEHIYKPYATQFQSMLGVHYFNALANPEHYKLFIYEGIAAFPSLHVGIIAVFAFFTYQLSRPVGILMFVYLLLVEFGSVLLGWHYAVDGIFAIMLVYVLYRFSIYFIRPINKPDIW